MNSIVCSIVQTVRRAVWIGLVGLAVWTARGAEQRFQVLEVNGAAYTNAVVTGKTATHLFISHAHGMASVKISSLDDATRNRLGLEVPRPSSSKSHGLGPLVRAAEKLEPEVNPAEPTSSQRNWRWPSLTSLPGNGLFNGLALAIVLGAIIGYPFMCRSCQQLCRRAGAPSLFLVWLPFLKRLALFKATGV